MNKENFITIIYDAIEDYNSVVAKEIELEKREDTLLFDPMSKLDSLGIIQIRAAIDEIMEQKYGMVDSVFACAKEYPRERPFKTVASTADYLVWYMEKKNVSK